MKFDRYGFSYFKIYKVIGIVDDAETIDEGVCGRRGLMMVNLEVGMDAAR